MRIAIISSHAWPLPSPARTGDSQILLDLTRTLAEMGHEVTLFAPKGTKAPEGVWLLTIPLCSHGTAEPSAKRAEFATLEHYHSTLSHFDIIHDCSVLKTIAGNFQGNALSTQWGGPPNHWRNVVAQSHAQRARLLRGATDYEGTATPEMGGPNTKPLADCRVVWNGIDTEAYKPTGKPKQDFFLMLGRWHPVRGIEQGIELAKATGINLLIAGTDPEEDHPAQAAYAKRICELVRGHDNISVEFLPMGNEEHHARKVELYSDARALLFLPQFQEPFGLPQIESLACGTPVIAPDIGSCKEVLGVVGVEEGIRAFMEEESDGFIESQGSAARKRACELFSREAMAERYLAEYYDVMSGRSWG
jgi:glycosyltransferase involved in cell wall biosynthesis